MTTPSCGRGCGTSWRAAGVQVVGEAAGGEEALALVRETSPDVLLLDMEMPGLTGVEVARRLRAVGSRVRILALSAYDDAGYIRGVLEAGAAGYLLKDEAPPSILAAVRRVAYGEEGWLSPAAGDKLVRRYQSTAGARNHGLTPRQLEVLRLVAAGRTNRQIGCALRIREGTVEKHVAAVFNILHVECRAEAVARALRLGLLD